MQFNSIQSSLLHFIRFLCSQAVLIAHLIVLLGWEYRTLISMASYAVMLFFILSGTLITNSLLERRTSDPRYGFSAFFRDRFFRIYPPFLAALILTFTLDIIAFEYTEQSYSLKQYFYDLIVNILQLQEFPPAVFLNEHFMIEFFRFRCLGSNIPLWTIGIEWWIYMFFGFAMFYVIRSTRIRAWQIGVLCCLALPPLYYLFVSARMENGITLYWFLGVLIAHAMRKEIHTKNSAASLLGLIILAGGLTLFPKIGYTNSAILFALGLTLFLNESKKTNEQYPRLKFISSTLAGYSYSLYLIHYPIIIFIITLFPAEPDANYFFQIYLSVNIIAFVFAHLFEKNSQKLKQLYENYRPHSN